MRKRVAFGASNIFEQGFRRIDGRLGGRKLPASHKLAHSIERESNRKHERFANTDAGRSDGLDDDSAASRTVESLVEIAQRNCVRTIAFVRLNDDADGRTGQRAHDSLQSRNVMSGLLDS